MKLGLLAVLLVAAGALAFGCGSSSDTLTLEEYFAEFEAIDADVDAQVGALFEDFPEEEDAFTDDANFPFVSTIIPARAVSSSPPA